VSWSGVAGCCQYSCGVDHTVALKYIVIKQGKGGERPLTDEDSFLSSRTARHSSNKDLLRKISVLTVQYGDTRLRTLLLQRSDEGLVLAQNHYVHYWYVLYHDHKRLSPSLSPSL
jgi:hypothetical protein